MTAAPRYPLHRPASSVPRRRTCPRSSRTSPRSRTRTARSRRRSTPWTPGTAPTSTSSTTARPSRTVATRHLLTGYADVVPRYRFMRRHRVERRFGCDTPACPPSSRRSGCSASPTPRGSRRSASQRSTSVPRSVLRYTGESREYVTRRARWVDFEHDYKTLDVTFIESVISAFKRLYDQDVATRATACCRTADDETPLSNHSCGWTTTSTIAAGPGADGRPAAGDRRAGPHLDDDAIDAAEQPGRRGRPGRRVHDRRARTELHARGRTVLLAAAASARTQRSSGGRRSSRPSRAGPGGRRYTPPFDYFSDRENAHRCTLPTS